MVPKRYILTSLAIHIFAVVAIGLHGCGAGEGQFNGRAKGGGNNVHIVPKITEVEILDTSKATVRLPDKPKAPKHKALHECKDDHWYGGVGFEESYLTNTIYKVYPGYPAAEAGLQDGDQLLTVNGIPESGTNEIRGQPGTEVTITVMRQGRIITLTMVRDKICTDR